MLEIKNLSVEIEGTKILKNINLKIDKGVHVLMGPNGSGKSTLCQVLMGNPLYTITEGDIIFEGKRINEAGVSERARLGLFLSFQYPVEIEGVNMFSFLRESYNTIHEQKLSILEFKTILETKANEIGLDKRFLDRYLNEGFSGGEKKKSEMLQLSVLNPKLAILDETDSGLDVDSIKKVAEVINAFASKDKTILVITHYKRILEYLSVDHVFVMKDGSIVLQGDKEIVDELEEKGYSWIENETDNKTTD
jgi:Fe-S cluster assembly ATP-binding protein